MADPQNFLDNLKNLRVVMSVALEHTQENRSQFVKNASPTQLRHFERLVTQARAITAQLEKELNTIEYLIAKSRSN